MPSVSLNSAVGQYTIITANYWAFTLTDGALRMLIILYFHQLGYTALELALLFVFYEVFGVVTNLLGGWLGARLGLNKTMNFGLLLQIGALAMLLVPNEFLTVMWVMAAQAISGIAKDLNKMSAKSAIKSLVPNNTDSTLFKWVALLTGSKNALKGVGFFMGGILLATIDFQGAIFSMAVALSAIFLISILLLRGDLGKARNKPKFTEIFSKSIPVNILSAARLFLFGARDIWFVIALPVYFTSQLGWSHSSIGSFFAIWIIGYGIIQSSAPALVTQGNATKPDGHTAFKLVVPLAALPISLAALIYYQLQIELVLVIGLLLFGVIFALNSAVHSFLIVDYAKEDGVSMDVGFYYMANAIGRLTGTVLSGLLFQVYGLEVCLIGSSVFLILAAAISLKLPRLETQNS
ncbi:organoarsenical effux MFS transporter ArsJ [Sneathiella glossodoripedis]|uniref:organoarsenical effux MFS transporter ArsJ n=1 Tax=Sneathiella glossodoripedis TaxID=418853 RepID=UPI000472DB6E